MKVNFHVLPQSIALNFEGKTVTIHREDVRHKKVLEAIREGKLELIPDLVNPSAAFNGTPFQLVDGAVTIAVDGQQLPESLSQRILDLQRDGLPFDSLIKFWDKLKRNPSFNSRQMLYKFLEHHGHPLTEDGNFIAYRSVRSDFKDAHTGTMDNSIGNVVEMPRESVDDNPNNTCSHGLHVAAFEYAKGFSEKLLEVEIDPIDVVAVPNDYNGQKMRVCKFKVVAECQGLREESVYGKPVATSEYEDDADAIDAEDNREREEKEAELEDLRQELSGVEDDIQSFDLDSGDINDLLSSRERRDELQSEIEDLENELN